MSSETDVALSVQGLSKCYQIYARPQDRLLQGLWRGRRQFYREFWALREISFELGRGEAVAIIGRNGSGKSTLLQLIAGVLTPTSGSVQAHGRVAALLELGSGFNGEFTGRENVALNAAILGLDAAEIERRMPEIEAFAEIGEFIDQPVKTYSSGMLMRLAFAVSVNVEPDILVVDEALSVGDIVFQFRCVERMNRLMEAGTTLLFVSHDLTMVKAFCRRAIYLEAGRTKMIAAAEEVAEAYIADSRDAQRRGIVPRAAADAGAAGAGRVLGARFSATSGERSTFVYGDEIEFEAEVQAPPGLARPTVSAMIQDRRLLTVAGTVCPIAASDGDARRVRVRFAARAVFAAGHYFITLRLENRLGDGSFLELDKQVGILSFEVMRSARQAFLGLVDISMTGREMK